MKPTDDPQLLALYDLLGRTGAREVQLRYSDDEQPVVWFAVATFRTPLIERWETAAGHDPVQALQRLAAEIIDGAECAHCGRPTIFNEAVEPILGNGLAGAVVDATTCVYGWDPELRTFRRGCEGSDR